MSQNCSLGQLFGGPGSGGGVAPDQALTIPDLGAQIQAGLGIDVDDVEASEVLLVTMLVDDSGSIAGAGNEPHVRAGHNLVLDALADSAQSDRVLVHTRYLNGQVLYPYVLLPQAVRMTPQNYRAYGGTPLYDQAEVTLLTVLEKAEAFRQVGVPARTVTLIVTDGADMHSRHSTARSVARLVRSMRREEVHVVAAMGVSDGGHTDFRAVFREMGVEDRWILTPRNNAHDIRQAFEVFSRSAARASQSAAHFGQVSLGGFGK